MVLPITIGCLDAYQVAGSNLPLTNIKLRAATAR